ncbi:MAG: MFS transporter [Candidatus Njordarchaeia archaeon]
MLSRGNGDRNIYRNIIGIAVTWSIVFPLFTMETQYEQIYMVVLGATPSIVGLVYGLSIIALSLARLVGGYLTDRIGRKKLIYVFTYIVGLLYLIPSFFADWRILAIALIIINASFMFQPAISAIMADSTSPETRGKYYSLMNTISLLSTIPAPLIAVSIIADNGIVEGMKLIYLVIALGFILAGFIRHMVLVETLNIEKIEIERINERGRRIIGDYLDALNFVKKYLKWPLAARIIMFMSGFAVLNFTGIYISETMGMGREYWGNVYFYANLITVIVIIFLGNISDRIDRRIPIVLSLTVYVPLVYILTVVRSLSEPVLMLSIILALSGILIVNNTIFTVLFALEADLIPKEIRGKTQAILALIGSTISAITQIIYGKIYEMDPVAIFQIASMIALIGSLVLTISALRRRKLTFFGRN